MGRNQHKRYYGRKYDGGYSLNLDTSKNQKYAIYYEGAYDAQAETLLYRTYIQSLNSYYPFSYQKMNGVKFTKTVRVEAVS